MPVPSPLNSAVGALCCTISDSQVRALSFCRIKAFQVYHSDGSARISSHFNCGASNSCSESSFLYSSENSHFRTRPSSQLFTVQRPNHEVDLIESGRLAPEGRGRKERFSVSLFEKVHQERRRNLSSVLKASFSSRDFSLDSRFPSRHLTGCTPPFTLPSLPRLHSLERSLLPGSLPQNVQRKNYATLRMGTVSSKIPMETSWKLGAESTQSSRSSEKETDVITGVTLPYEDGVELNGGGCAETCESDGFIEGVLADRVRVSAERRRRATSSTSRPGPEWRDLLTVPGIGRRNMEKLVAKGIFKLDELKQLYRDKVLITFGSLVGVACYRSHGTEKMVEFLRSSVGVQKHHAASITDFIKTSVEAEDGMAESGRGLKKRLTFCVEGNISVGKTTFLQRIANETIELRDLVEIVPEPISKWQDVGPDHFNILDAFYGDPERYAYTFQNYVFVTRMMQERESAVGEKRLRLMERSVFSDRMVFVRAVHEAKWMSDAEISIYDSWFDPVVSAMPGLIPDAFIYLRATPDTCHRRLQSRKRKEEDTVTLDYLRDLHEKHEQWLLPAEHRGSNLLSVSDWASEHRVPLSPRLKDRVLYLRGENVHSSIQKVPALILDCEPSIDFSKDIEAKAEYARQVAEFFEYVQGLKNGQLEAQSGLGSIVLPRSGVLLGPDGNVLRSSSVDGVDLRRHVSSARS
ncbi:hypothetical protein AXG93_4762s1050 [Marchantia polymorpha subsp. ruderalis]|uniref:Deoxynucleoside kinase domain-containing protein n=1 Tax=Marchantia polymorpha subsp. ruderalis TaxID=1480154 RepID=A0A176W368_MARPO|nr:hypothetical protein AXG93_4762s1050 [Marchantia polymorpha subsp. ruderalis]